MSQSVYCTAVVGTCLSVCLFSCTGFLIHARWTLTVLSSASHPPTSCFTWAPRKSPRMSQLFVSYSCCCICPLSSIIKSRRLTFFGHLAWMDNYADASQAMFKPPPENWRRPPGRPHTTRMKNIHDDLSSLDLGIHEARDLAQNRPLWRLMFWHSAMHSYWCMLLLD